MLSAFPVRHYNSLGVTFSAPLQDKVTEEGRGLSEMNKFLPYLCSTRRTWISRSQPILVLVYIMLTWYLLPLTVVYQLGPGLITHRILQDCVIQHSVGNICSFLGLRRSSLNDWLILVIYTGKGCNSSFFFITQTIHNYLQLSTANYQRQLNK